jgi:hypothetical protein
MKALTDREARKATEARMRRGEPAPDIERAKVEAEMARRELHRRGAARLLDANQRRWGEV